MTTKELKERIATLEAQVAGKGTKETVTVGLYEAPNGKKIPTISFKGGRAGWKGLSMGKVKAQMVVDNLGAIQKFIKDGKLS